MKVKFLKFNLDINERLIDFFFNFIFKKLLLIKSLNILIEERIDISPLEMLADLLYHLYTD